MCAQPTESWGVECKADNSPLTRADKAANKVICDALLARWPSIPIISEENEAVPYETRAAWSHFWLVDPLDGTKEFIKRNGQFTVRFRPVDPNSTPNAEQPPPAVQVNIGLCCGSKPVAGVVYVPAAEKPRMYYGVSGVAAFRQVESEIPAQIQVRPTHMMTGLVGCCARSSARDRAALSYDVLQVQKFTEADEGLTLVASASHSSPETEAFVAKYPGAQLKSLGSSLKLLMVAEVRKVSERRRAMCCIAPPAELVPLGHQLSRLSGASAFEVASRATIAPRARRERRTSTRDSRARRSGTRAHRTPSSTRQAARSCSTRVGRRSSARLVCARDPTSREGGGGVSWRAD